MATLARTSNLEAARDDFYDRLTPESLAPLWKVLAALVTPTPRTPAVPAAWSFDRVQSFLMEAGDLITAAEAERRVLILENPALQGQSRIIWVTLPVHRISWPGGGPRHGLVMAGGLELIAALAVLRAHVPDNIAGAAA